MTKLAKFTENICHEVLILVKLHAFPVDFVISIQSDSRRLQTKKLTFSVENFFSKYEQIRLRICSHLLGKIFNGKLYFLCSVNSYFHIIQLACVIYRDVLWITIYQTSIMERLHRDLNLPWFWRKSTYTLQICWTKLLLRNMWNIVFCTKPYIRRYFKYFPKAV